MTLSSWAQHKRNSCSWTNLARIIRDEFFNVCIFQSMELAATNAMLSGLKLPFAFEDDVSKESHDLNVDGRYKTHYLF